MADRLALGQAVLAAQPFSRLLGAELTAFGDDGVVLELPLKEEHHQQFGFAHGGVVAYLVDNALTFAGGLALGPEIVTIELKVNYAKPAVGERLVARATIVTASRNVAVTRCDVFARRGADETLCAAAQGTIGRLPSRDAEAGR